MKTSSGLDSDQRLAWDSAQALWGVRMHEPILEPDAQESSFAWFSFPPRITVDPVAAKKLRVTGMWESIFAHELGHHVLSPSTRVVDLKIRQQMARAITATAIQPRVALSAKSALLSNLWSDMLINVRVSELQHRVAPTVEPQMIGMWRVLESKHTTSAIWWVTMHAYEELWGLADGSLCGLTPPAMPEASADYTSLYASDPVIDSSLLAETVRTFADDPIRGALRFGMIMAPYLLADQEEVNRAHVLQACGGDVSSGAPTPAELDEVMRDKRLRETPVHPVLEGRAADTGSTDTDAESEGGRPEQQGYGLAETLRLYEGNDESTVLDSWYAAEARGWVRPYRQLATATSHEESMPGALELWSLEDELEQIDWPATLTTSPKVIPGVTTRLRTHFADDIPRQQESVHLDLYIDSSGSMRPPRAESPAVLAGTILIMSVLSGGGRVRVTSFSGPGDVAGSERFSRERAESMRRLLTYFGGGTTFPLDLLARRYAQPKPSAAAPLARRHLVVLSDEGLASFFGTGQENYAGVAADVRLRLDTATLLVMDRFKSIADPAARAGYDVGYLESMDDAPAACAALAQRIANYSELERSRG